MPYYQLFDAFQKGQLNLDISVDNKLIEAQEKAYDPTYRSANQISVAWDRAYYDGKYYCYFGPAPLVMFYYPTYLITHQLPTEATAALFFSWLCILFGFMLVFRIAKAAVKRPNFILTLLCAIGLPFASSIYTLCAYGDIYTIPKLCGTAFLLLLFYLTLIANDKPKWYLYLLCGVCVAIIAASRPNLLVVALCVAPFYIKYIMQKSIAIKQKLCHAAAFAAPLAIGAITLMAYNYLRFDSIFEFGAKYQLTVNNISCNNLSFGLLAAALFHYFLQPPAITQNFPYVAPSNLLFNNYSRYFYITASFGALALPLNWSFAALPAVRKKSKLKKEYIWFILLSLILSVGVAFTDFAMAGVTISYVADILPVLSVCAFLIILSLEQCTREYAYLHKTVYIVSVLLILSTIIISFGLLLATDPYIIQKNAPDTFEYMRKALMF